jgi:hypothetical protein
MRVSFAFVKRDLAHAAPRTVIVGLKLIGLGREVANAFQAETFAVLHTEFRSRSQARWCRFLPCSSFGRPGGPLPSTYCLSRAFSWR